MKLKKGRFLGAMMAIMTDSRIAKRAVMTVEKVQKGWFFSVASITFNNDSIKRSHKSRKRR